MPSSEMDDLVSQLRGIAEHQGGALTDGQLLEAFVARGDGPAFETLVRRHASMVHGVCRRVVGNGHDADDAFQATFLVFVRKARTIVPREFVGNWLYGVAYRTALKARFLTARRHLLERRMTEIPQSKTTLDDRAELLHLLDRELERLPAKYRLPIVLCDLECRTRRDAARQLGLPVGTLSGRLTTAHRLLLKRLARHGLVVSGTALSAALAEQADAGVSFEVISSTIRAAALFADGSAASAGIVPCKAASLAEGVLKTMLLSKIKLASAMLASVVIIGAGLMAYEGQGSGRAQPPRESPATPPPKRGSFDEEQAKSNLESARKKVIFDEAKLRQAEANLEQAKAQLEVANAQLQRAKLEYDEARARFAKPQLEPADAPTKLTPGRAVLEVRGYLRPARLVQVTSSVAGKVTEVHAQEGDPVSAGQLLASLDSGNFRNDVERAQVNIELARARLGEAKASQSNEKMQQNIYAARIQVAEAELKRAEIELAQAKSQLDKTQLRAPIAGIVSRRQVEIGDSVNPLQGQRESSRLFELIDPRMLVVVVPIAERDIAVLQQSQRVRIEVDALPGTSLDGKVERVAPTIEPADATLKIRISLKIPDGDMRWKPGMSVRAAFLAKE